MAKDTQTFRRQNSTNCLSVFDHFRGVGAYRVNVPNSANDCSKGDQWPEIE